MVSILCCKGIVIIIPGFVGTLLLLVVLGLEAKSCNVAWFATIMLKTIGSEERLLIQKT
jgi:hypothetical protein